MSLDDIPWCDSPNPFINQYPSLKVEGAIDCHAHVFGPEHLYPYTKNRTYTPHDAAVGSYLHMHACLGIDKGVLVQPSVYGTDNRLQCDTLNYLKKLGKHYKGVAVVDADVTDKELDNLEDAGHCGVRMNLLFRGGIDWKDVVKMTNRLADRQWHIQFLVDISEFENFESRVRQLPVPVVIDHMGHLPALKGISNPGFKSLLTLMGEGRAWVKLSGAYRITSEKDYPYNDVTQFATSLILANPENCIWGSDWPHPHFSIPMPNTGDLFHDLDLWAPDQKVREKILTSNAIRLYNF